MTNMLNSFELALPIVVTVLGYFERVLARGYLNGGRSVAHESAIHIYISAWCLQGTVLWTRLMALSGPVQNRIPLGGLHALCALVRVLLRVSDRSFSLRPATNQKVNQ